MTQANMTLEELEELYDTVNSTIESKMTYDQFHCALEALRVLIQPDYHKFLFIMDESLSDLLADQVEHAYLLGLKVGSKMFIPEAAAAKVDT